MVGEYSQTLCIIGSGLHVINRLTRECISASSDTWCHFPLSLVEELMLCCTNWGKKPSNELFRESCDAQD